MESLLHDISWVEPLRHPMLTPLFHGFTALGYGKVLMLILPLGYWLWNRPLFLRLTLLVLTSALINALLKDLIQDPRPQGLQIDSDVGESWGMPSGHAQIALVLWGWLAWEVNRRWCRWLCAVLICGITFSRLYLGVHDPEDLLAGLALGAATLAVYARLQHHSFWRQNNIAAQLLLITAVTLLAWQWWPEGGVSPALKLGGVAAGAIFGAWMEGQEERIELPGWGWRLLFAPLAVLGLVLLQQAIDLLPKTDGATLLGGLLTGFYITRLAPAIWRLSAGRFQPSVATRH